MDIQRQLDNDIRNRGQIPPSAVRKRPRTELESVPPKL
jgi:hypothetical protein